MTKVSLVYSQHNNMHLSVCVQRATVSYPLLYSSSLPYPPLPLDLALGRSDNVVDDRIHSELEYLDGRVEFWRQQKPMYARKREKELKKVKPEPTQPIGMSLRAQSGPSNHARYVLKSLEEIDAGKSTKRLGCTM